MVRKFNLLSLSCIGNIFLNGNNCHSQTHTLSLSAQSVAIDILNYILIQASLFQSDPKKFCTQLGLCKASKERIMAVLLNKAIAAKMKAFKGIAMKKHVKNLSKSMPIKSSAECILCEFIASKLEQTLTKNATEVRELHPP